MNPDWIKGCNSPNPLGRPSKNSLLLKPKTNRQIREEELLSLCRKFKPLQSKAIQAAVKILDNNEAADQNKLKAASLLLGMYRDLLKDTFHKDYDTDAGVEVQQNNAAVFSLKMIDDVEFKEKSA